MRANSEGCLFFGLASGFELELGYYSLKDIKKAKGSLGFRSRGICIMSR